jgi:steroid delta-isomerase-like uncharacterized protein
MANERETIVHEWFERVWNQGQAEAIDELLAADARIHGLRGADGSDVGGPAEFRQMHTAFREAFPDMRIEVDECLVDGDRIAFRCRVRGTHGGRSLGVEATGNTVEFMGMGFVRVRGGQIAEAWNAFDFQAMNEQIGRGGGGTK